MSKFTEGNITKQIILFSIPIFLGTILQQFYTLADTMMVGQLLGTDALAAVGASSSIAILLINLCNGFSGGFAIVIGQHYGAGDTEKLNKALAATYILSFIICSILVVFSLSMTGRLLKWTNVPENIFDTAGDYLRIMAAGLFISMLYNLMANILRALGDSTIPLIFLIISVIVNIALDYFFIAVLKTGVKGAAVATVISQGISGIGCTIFCMIKRPVFRIYKKDFSGSLKLFSTLFSQGLSMALMLSVVNTGTVILQSGINGLGQEIIAGYTAGRKYLEFFMLGGGTLSATAAVFTSQNFGAGKTERIKKGAFCIIRIGWIWSTIAIIIIFLAGRFLIISITGSEAGEKIIQAGILYMKSNVIFFYVLIILSVLRNVLQGMNQKKTPLAASLIELTVKVISVFFIVPRIGYLGICITEPVIWILGAIWVSAVFLYTIKRNYNSLAI